ncbi:hypothetical protein P3H15_44045 [Rhodococcus sp. T2V]|nr:hypothetical protein [Rhodococcus sp. T2V]
MGDVADRTDPVLGVGRPTLLGPTQVTSLRLTDAEHALCVAAAAKAGQRIDAWMRDRILDAARAGGAGAE